MAVWGALAPAGASQYRNENPALLGVVTEPRGKHVGVVHVVPGSPAESAGIRAGDVLVSIGDAVIRTPGDVDKALRGVAPGSAIRYSLRRAGGELVGSATVVERTKLDTPIVLGRQRGTVGFQAPEWFAYGWDTGDGIEPPLRSNTGGKVVVIHAFQSWCPGCHERGFPVTKRIEDRFADADDVIVFHLQTVFEGASTNTPERGPEEARKYGIQVPVAFDAHVDGARVSSFMAAYGTGGTPWSVVIGKDGVVRFSDFTPDGDTLARVIEGLRNRS